MISIVSINWLLKILYLCLVLSLLFACFAKLSIFGLVDLLFVDDETWVFRRKFSGLHEILSCFIVKFKGFIGKSSSEKCKSILRLLLDDLMQILQGIHVLVKQYFAFSSFMEILWLRI